ncbi:MOSC domain containing protein [Acidisarcina polymorpha]|uniref:MOSC domain containing protein n=1 Tax=Acidisarcina polymorpha TaxID=2211140 RepID=A0A2Z5G897_9BACT|nr:MOSC domain-containing protein [Acidisarcina polymorpha]AXC14865.1 MOSC domain containing protein [Acidisarcina polymorpha]
MLVGVVESLWRYPVKSMRGERLEQAYLGFSGVYGDRRYAFLSSAAPKDFPYFTAREKHSMLLERAIYRNPEKMVSPQDGSSLADGTLEIETTAGERLPIEDPRLAELLREGVAERHLLRLIQSEIALVDSRPISLFSLQTVRQLSVETGMELDKRRFRANIYADLSGAKGFVEDEWVGQKLEVGRQAVMQVAKRNMRCKLITLDPDSAQPSPEVMKLVAREHQSCAGIYLTAVIEGMVSVGDSIRLVDSSFADELSGARPA